MRNFVSILVVLFVMAFAVPSMACDGPDCRIDHNRVDHNAGILGEKNHHNVVNTGTINYGTTGDVTANGGKAVIKEGAVVNNNSNIIEKGAIKNKNVNDVDINNKNKQNQQQGQLQGQMQGQGQKQGQGQMNNWSQIYEDKRDHVQGPGLIQSDAKLQRGKPFTSKVRLIKEFMSNIDELSVAQAKKLASKASDITCEPALIMENEFSTNKVKCQYFGDKAPGDFMGYLYMGSDGGDVNTPSMIGEAAKKALRAGATHMRLIFVDAGESNNGDSWNIGLGGGASIMANGDATAIAPNGGLGIGHADSFSELRPEMVFELTFDSSLTANYKLSKAELGYSASSIEVTQLR